MGTLPEQKQQVVVTDIGEYVNQHCCERSFKLRLNKAEVARRFPFYATVRSPLNPILTTTGRKRENDLEAGIRESMPLLNPHGETEEPTRMGWEQYLTQLERVPAGQDCFAREVEIERPIGEFVVSGRMDFVVLRWLEGAPHLRIVECKASRKDKTYHRIQLAAYRAMVGEVLEQSGLVLGGELRRDVVLESVVARIDEETNEVQDALGLPSLDLREEIEDLRMAVSEAVTNAIVHGYGRGYRGEDPSVTIGCTISTDEVGALLTVTVADRGVGIADVALAMRPLYTTEPGAERAGMGFTVMETFMDSVSVDSKPGEGTVVTLTKRISGITEEP
jgi:anti-sigma F factor